MNKWKSLIGIGLILLSLAGLIFWELQGRQMVLTKPVLVAAREIPAGEKVTAEHLSVAFIPKENLVEGALSWKERSRLSGSYARTVLLKNQQLAEAYVMKEKELLKEGNSFFVLPAEWIAMRSSSLRRGDRITLYGNLTGQLIGTYRTAFIKDEAEQEVTAPEGAAQKNMSDRTVSTAQIDHLELLTTLEEYCKIREAAALEEGFLVVQNTGPELSRE